MSDTTPAHRMNWFAPDRPVEGATVYVRPPHIEGEACTCLCGGHRVNPNVTIRGCGCPHDERKATS